MNTKLLFQKISQRMMTDFEISRQVKHNASKGSVRENYLKDFLSSGRMPAKYGIGSGEIVGRIRDTSRQSDLIIFDKPNGVTLIYDDTVQVYPIDCIYGIVEVKSELSKTELLDALEKIKVFKEMAPDDVVTQTIGGGALKMAYRRSRPFGMIFAYSLSNNSLDSLIGNLREWEANNPPHVWPNYICILQTGIIKHQKGVLEDCLDSDQITEESLPISLHHKEDSLFEFYCTLHDVCSRITLGPVELKRYFEPSIRIGKYILSGHVEGDLVKDGTPTGKKARFTEKTIDKIVSWCNENGKMRYRDTFIKRLGAIPEELGDAILDSEVFLYNPDNLPGLHEIGPNPIKMENGKAVTTAPCLASLYEMYIDGKYYLIAPNGFLEDDYETVDS